jgi:hypothetical protein
MKSFAVYKASYNERGNKSGKSDVVGGICGTAFFISDHEALSAGHVINPGLFSPNSGYARAQVWLVSETGGVIEIHEEQVRSLPDVDAALIRFEKSVVSQSYVFEIAADTPPVNTAASMVGYRLGSGQPALAWEGDRLRLSRVLNLEKEERSGDIEALVNLSISASDVKLNNIHTLKFSAGSRVGMSGGPTLVAGKVVGLNSLGFPVDQEIKRESFSISMDEIRKRL